jgi:hypothetical protein
VPGSSPDAPSVTALLNRTTPTRVPPLDLDALARRGRSRRRRHRAALAGGAAAVVAGLVVVAVAVGLTGNHPAEVGTAGEGSQALTLTEPVGSWSQAADPPFAPRAEAFTGSLPDGRVLV